MVAVLGYLMFTAAFAVSMWVFAFTLAPAMPRIVALLRGEIEPEASLDGFAIVSDRRLRRRVQAVQPARPASFRAAA